MAKLVYGLSQSLDGCDVDHTKLGPPVPVAFRHFIELVRGLSGRHLRLAARTRSCAVIGEEDLPDWDAEESRVRGGVAKPAEVGRVAFP